MKLGRVRVNISLAEDIKKYMDCEAERSGLNLSAFITMCVLQYRKQDESIATMADIINELSKDK